MARNKRNWHPDFIEYMNIIVNHSNYEGMPEPFDENGNIKWVVAGSSSLGKKRAKWWDDKVKKMQLKNRAEVARAIHPKELNGLKPCQICGKKLRIFYEYPNKNTVKKFEKITPITFPMCEHTILENYDILQTSGKNACFVMREVFDVPYGTKESKTKCIEYITTNCTSKLSPGVMSNAPDRFDGFHTYNACCRHKEDKGRHKENMSRYTQDRRAYENWAEGNWNLSNRLMGEFNKYGEKLSCPQCTRVDKMSADHIGPISLGFIHRPKFNALCKSCNSSKNNRMTLNDVKTLITDEKNGNDVVSWHSMYIWNYLKDKVTSDSDALELSKMMRIHLHSVLCLLSFIYSRGYCDFLCTFLHPEYSYYDYKFKNFHPFKLDELNIESKPLGSKNKIKNSKRYIRISFESLDEYASKINRNIRFEKDESLRQSITQLFELLDENEETKAHAKLYFIIEEMSNKQLTHFAHR